MIDTEKSLDSQLWHACAGGMVQMPHVNSRVFYFPQGHAEHASGMVDFGALPKLPALILSRVAAVKFMADPESDEVYAKIRLVPIMNDESGYDDTDEILGGNAAESSEKPSSFAKTLTQSDANNGGGFSVPRYCAETIFPPLDFSADPPVQTVTARDVHGETWKFRHIFRGTPRRHLLTTGWSAFVNQKKLVAGDSIVFLKADNKDLCVGIRRAKRGIQGGPETPSVWSSASGNSGYSYGSFSVLLKEEENTLARSGLNGSLNSGGGFKGRGKVSPQAITEAVLLAASGQPFEVVYYPRAGTPEFCIKASSVRASMRIQWCPGMRFKMPFETEDSSRISWFMGTISSIQVSDPIRWPNSPWRVLQVTWDEPELLQNVKCVSPWLVELVSNTPMFHMSPFSPPRKKLRFLQHPPDFPLDGHFPVPSFSGNPLGSSSPLCCLTDDRPAGGIQGARHAQFGTSFSDIPLNSKLQLGLFSSSFPQFDPRTKISDGTVSSHKMSKDNVSCLLTIGNPKSKIEETDDADTPRFILFGQPILTEQQIARSSSSEAVSQTSNRKSSSDGRHSLEENLSCGGLSQHQDHDMTELGLGPGHCKVFMESDDVGRTLDLSVIGSYEELYKKLANMFEIERSKTPCHVLYQDASGSVKQTGDEPFSDFAKTARRLTILLDSGSNSVGRKWITAMRNAEHGLDSSKHTGALSIFA